MVIQLYRKHSLLRCLLPAEAAPTALNGPQARLRVSPLLRERSCGRRSGGRIVVGSVHLRHADARHRCERSVCGPLHSQRTVAAQPLASRRWAPCWHAGTLGSGLTGSTTTSNFLFGRLQVGAAGACRASRVCVCAAANSDPNDGVQVTTAKKLGLVSPGVNTVYVVNRARGGR